uniref:Protein kinase domain-containing protein n=1 Tax=Rhabditophanes sp. KR3021 TaxID=114890 RepID=A0AC35U1J4_9BILA
MNTETEFGYIDEVRIGETVATKRTRYKVLKLLGEGGYGSVFKVQEVNEPKNCYAMKCEKKIPARAHPKLKMEVAILKLLNIERAQQSHFVKLIDRAKKTNYYLILMELLGPNLSDLRHAMPKKHFSLATGFSVAVQCLEGLEDLHKCFYIHRDVKSCNFACGRGLKKKMVYLLDFGMARKIVNDGGEVKSPREKCRFKGTVKFSSLNAHKGYELGRKDDIESWCYMIAELMSEVGLPWKKIQDKEKVFLAKKAVRLNYESLFAPFKFAKEYGKILEYVDGLSYPDKVDYIFIYEMLKLMTEMEALNMNAPLDWE